MSTERIFPDAVLRDSPKLSTERSLARSGTKAGRPDESCRSKILKMLLFVALERGTPVNFSAACFMNCTFPVIEIMKSASKAPSTAAVNVRFARRRSVSADALWSATCNVALSSRRLNGLSK